MNGSRPSALAVEHLSHRYRGAERPALADVSLSVQTGERLALLGPNGSGKSTLFRVIAQLLRPDAGTVSVCGDSQPGAIRRRIGVVFQTPSLDGQLTVRENLAAHAALQGLGSAASAARIDELLGALGLADRRNQRVRTLSLGLARRVDLCRALLHRPELLLLDEATVGLDPPSREGFMAALEQECAARGTASLMSTHLVDEADRANRVVLIHRGALVAEGTPAALRSGLGSRLVTVASSAMATTAEPPSIASLGSIAGAAFGPESWTRTATGFTAPIADDAAAASVAEALARSGVSFSIAPPTLADLFRTTTGDSLDADQGQVGEPLGRGQTRDQRRRSRAR